MLPIAQEVEVILGRATVFYDDWYEHWIAGPDADLLLQRLYEGAELVVMCVSGAYGNKPWTRTEHLAVRAQLMRARTAEDRQRIFPVRVGDGDVEDVLFNEIVPDVRDKTPVEAAELIVARLNLVRANADGSGSVEGSGPVSSVVSWDMLSSAAQDVFSWAIASENPNPRIGTRGLLIGLLRTAYPSEARQLLEYVRVQREEVFDALQQVRIEVKLNPTVRNAISLTALPPLTPNCQRVLRAAFQLQAGGSSQVELRHLFGAILQVEQSRAWQALEKVLEGRIPAAKIRLTYPDFLRTSPAQSYGDFLQEQFIGERPSTSITADTWTDCDQLEYGLYADAIAQFILDPKTKAPLTIGIKAPWGAGKTSLMRMYCWTSIPTRRRNRRRS